MSSMRKLKDKNEALASLNYAVRSGDISDFIFALYNISQINGGMTALAEKTGFSREALYKSLHPARNPRYHTIVGILRALGYNFKVVEDACKEDVEVLPMQPLERISLAAMFPLLAAEWHPDKNKGISPDDIPIGSRIKGVWRCMINPDHEWNETVTQRVKGSSCPECKANDCPVGKSIADINPDLVHEWHPLKNGNLSPQRTFFNSGDLVWWQCKNGHEWRATPWSRNKGKDCAKCKSL